MPRTLLILFFLFLSNFLYAQGYITSINHYDLEDGLSHNQVHWVYQDSRGMMWIGAANGINRYDGKEFKLVAPVNFFYAPNAHILEDHEGDLWLVRNYWERELFFFNIKTEQIKTFEEKFKTPTPFESHDFYNAIELKDSTTIISTNSGQLFGYSKKGEFQKLASPKNGATQLIGVPGTLDFWTLGEDLSFKRKKKGGTISTLFQHDIEKHHYYLGLTKQSALLLRDSSQIYNQYNSNGTLQHFELPDKNKENAYQEFAYDPNRDHFLSLDRDTLKLNPRLERKANVQSKFIGTLNAQSSNKFLLNDDIYWISNIYGLTKLQIRTGDFKKVDYKDPAIYGPTDFKSCRLLWSYVKNETLEDIPDFEKKYDYWTYYVDKNQRIWMGGFSGLYYFDQEDLKPTRFKSTSTPGKYLKSRVYHIYKDNDQQLWVVSANGLFRFSPDEGLTQRYSSEDPDQFLPSLELRHMHQDAEGIYWIGSYDGLIRWDKKNNQHRLFTTKDGLSNNHIMAVYEDDFGFLWLSSDNGIMQFEKSSNRVKVYLPKDGITHREFNRGSHYKDDDGFIYFGSLNGMTYFHPKDFVDRFYEVPKTPLLLTECTVLSAQTAQHENRMAHWLQGQKITIQPGDQNLQLKFALLDYESNNPNALQYVYSMNGNDTWDIGNGNVLSFNGLAYGEHVLKVKGRTGNGVFSNQELVILICVLKPFYLQNWFLILVGLGLISLLFLLQKIKTRSLIRRQQTLEKEVKLRTKTIQTQAEELRELDKAKSRFLANISHEFRTPLTLILNTLNQDDFEKLSSQDANIMRRNAGRLQQLIDQLLDLSKLEAGKMGVNLKDGDFLFYLKQMVESFEPLAQKNNIALNFKSQITQSQLQFDRDKIDKIVYNLLANAIKFTPQNGSIDVELSNKNENVCIQIKDNGVGIEEKEQAKIFDRFYQINSPEDFTYEGTGLGLALVQELVEVQQGTIELKSQKGQGTCFKIYLPLQKATALSSLAPINRDNLKVHNNASPARSRSRGELTCHPSPENPEDTSPNRPIILLIEDNDDLLYHYQKTFSKDYEILLANNGDKGLTLAMEHIPDIIICDIMMPGKNGYEVCEILKSDKKTNHIPIILLTAKAGQESKIKGLSFGANEYLTKPYDQKELSLRIKNLLKQRAQLQKRFQSNKEPHSPTPKFLTPQEQFVQKCQELIEANLTQRNFGVEELSQELNMSRTHLFRKLKSITGIAPTLFIRTYRLEKAKALLSQFAGNGSEISYMVGFSNPNYFFKCFKDEYGMTVGEFLSKLEVDV